MELPVRVTVKSLQSSRYTDNLRPQNWDQRQPGVDSITTDAGQSLVLVSNAQQPPPQPGWVILLTRTCEVPGHSLAYEWTLYGLPKGAKISGLEAGMSEVVN